MRKISLELPEEFIDLCRDHDITPEAVLKGFVDDLCNLVSSHGSDESDLAWQYFDRCGYGR